MLSGYLLMFCRWALGLTFAISAVGKARDLAGFRIAITDLRVLPAGLARPAAASRVTAVSTVVAVSTVAAEGLVVLALAAGQPVLPAGFALAAVLLVLFSAVLVAALRRGAGVSCNCFGAGERPVSRYDLVRNGALLACCGVGEWSYFGTGHPQPPAAGIVLLGLMAGCFFLIVMNSEAIVELLGRPYRVE